MVLVLLGVILLVSIVSAVGILINARRGSSEQPKESLEALEKRLLDAVGRTRSDLDGAIRQSSQELTQQAANAQRDLALALVNKLDSHGSELTKQITGNFHTTQALLGSALDAARGSQEERLGKVEAKLGEFAVAFSRSVGEMRAALGESSEKLQGTLASSVESFQARNTQALADLAQGVTNGLTTARSEQATALDASRHAQDDRLDKVEAKLGEFAIAFNRAVSDMKTELVQSSKSLGETLAGSSEALQRNLRGTLGELNNQIVATLDAARKEQTTALQDNRKSMDEARETQLKSQAAMQASLASNLKEFGEAQVASSSQLQDRVQARLDEMRKDNEAKLETIRATVEDRLQSTLEARLGESFKIVSERLEQVYRGLGEMQALATGVGDLKRVLTNVRARGTFGEVQLGALLEQVLTAEQYACNVATSPHARERVEFAIKLPGRDGDERPVFLPIDAKFPQEDFLRLQDAYEAGDQEAVEAARAGLRRRLLSEADTIHSKYVDPPHTTDFAILFVPTEGLYAEVLRLPGLCDELQSKHRVVPAGPTTLWALLNSLQMGFRTLAIEKRSSEVWKILGAVKTEFGKFGASLEAVGKKLEEASNKLGDTKRRSRVMQRKLSDVESLPESQAVSLLANPVDDLEDVTA